MSQLSQVQKYRLVRYIGEPSFGPRTASESANEFAERIEAATLQAMDCIRVPGPDGVRILIDRLWPEIRYQDASVRLIMLDVMLGYAGEQTVHIHWKECGYWPALLSTEQFVELRPHLSPIPPGVGRWVFVKYLLSIVNYAQPVDYYSMRVTGPDALANLALLMSETTTQDTIDFEPLGMERFYMLLDRPGINDAIAVAIVKRMADSITKQNAGDADIRLHPERSLYSLIYAVFSVGMKQSGNVPRARLMLPFLVRLWEARSPSDNFHDKMSKDPHASRLLGWVIDKCNDGDVPAENMVDAMGLLTDMVEFFARKESEGSCMYVINNTLAIHRYNNRYIFAGAPLVPFSPLTKKFLHLLLTRIAFKNESAKRMALNPGGPASDARLKLQPYERHSVSRAAYINSGESAADDADFVARMQQLSVDQGQDAFLKRMERMSLAEPAPNVVRKQYVPPRLPFYLDLVNKALTSNKGMDMPNDLKVKILAEFVLDLRKGEGPAGGLSDRKALEYILREHTAGANRTPTFKNTHERQPDDDSSSSSSSSGRSNNKWMHMSPD